MKRSHRLNNEYVVDVNQCNAYFTVSYDHSLFTRSSNFFVILIRLMTYFSQVFFLKFYSAPSLADFVTITCIFEHRMKLKLKRGFFPKPVHWSFFCSDLGLLNPQSTTCLSGCQSVNL